MSGLGKYTFEAWVPAIQPPSSKSEVPLEAPGAGPRPTSGKVLVPMFVETEEEDELEGSVVWDSSVVLARLLLDETKFPQKFFTPGRRFIELGSGCGLPGMAAALRGAEVTLTDIEDVLPRLQRNVAANFAYQGNAQQQALDEGIVANSPPPPYLGENAKISVSRLDWTRLEEDVAALVESRNDQQPVATEDDGCTRNAPTSDQVPCCPFDVVLVADCVYQERLVQPLVDTMVAVSGPKTVVLLTMRARFSFQADFLVKLKEIFAGTSLDVEEHHVHGATKAEDIYALRLKRRSKPSAAAGAEGKEVAT